MGLFHLSMMDDSSRSGKKAKKAAATTAILERVANDKIKEGCSPPCYY
jgi:hypothetical protein